MAEKSSRKPKESKEPKGTSAEGQRVREAYQKLGHMGGEAVKEKYGPEFYSQIGKKGGEKGGEARKAQMARGEITANGNGHANGNANPR